MSEKKIVTWEMFKKYHEHLMGHINEGDGLALDEEEFCEEGEVEEDEC